MKNENTSSGHQNRKPTRELEWIDLENESKRNQHTSPAHTSKKSSPHPKTSHKKRGFRFNFHIIFLSLILIVFATIAFKLLFWDKNIRQDNEIESDTSLNFDTEPMDSIVPLDSSGKNTFERDDELTILFLGNGSLAEDKDSDTNMANIVKSKTGATIYNCAIPGSYLSMYKRTYRNSYPYDAFSFYNLCTVFTADNSKTLSWAKRDLGGFPEEIETPLNLLQSIDYSKLDILCIYYDASDYLEQRPLYDDDNHTNPSTTTGALDAGIQLIQQALPHVRIIVMSPHYAYAIDNNGHYTSSFSTELLKTPLVDYVSFEQLICMDHHVSFVDNFYGTIHESNAKDYLTDNIHTNPEGSSLLADRFIYALNQFNDYDFSAYE